MLNTSLRHRIDIQRKVIEIDSDGIRREEWETIRQPDEALIPAAIVPLSGREFVAAQAVQAGVTTRINVRVRPGIKPAMRIVHGDEIYNIRAVLPDPTLRRHLTIMAEMGVNDG